MYRVNGPNQVKKNIQEFSNSSYLFKHSKQSLIKASRRNLKATVLVKSTKETYRASVTIGICIQFVLYQITFKIFEMNRSLNFTDPHLLALIQLLKIRTKHAALGRINSYSFLFQRFVCFLPFISSHHRSIKKCNNRDIL